MFKVVPYQTRSARLGARLPPPRIIVRDLSVKTSNPKTPNPINTDHQSIPLDLQFDDVPRIPRAMEGLSVDVVAPQTLRYETISEIIKRAQTEGVILVKGPPFSGKSTLAQLTHKVLKRYDIRTNLVTCINSESIKDWPTFWENQTNSNWAETVKEANDQHTFVLVDEAQRLYKHPSQLWDVCKQVQAVGLGKRLSIILFSLYESKASVDGITPFVIPESARFTLRTLLFSQTEYAELIADFNKKNWILPPDISKYIFQITKGHPGVTTGILHFMRYQINAAATKGLHFATEIFLLLRSPTFIDFVKGLRGVEIATLEKKETKLLDQILAEDKETRIQEDSNAIVAQELVKQGILSNIAPETYDFASPIHRLIYFRKRYLSPNAQANLLSLPDLIKTIVVRMKPSALNRTVSLATDKRPLERLWQMEFYRSATSLLPRNYVISPDAGTTFQLPKDSIGYIDFWINSDLKYGVELLREGKDFKEHQKRFRPGGIYQNIIKQAKGWVIVDFRSSKKRVKINRGPNAIHVFYSDDFTKVTLRQNGSEETLLLQGDTLGVLGDVASTVHRKSN